MIKTYKKDWRQIYEIMVQAEGTGDVEVVDIFPRPVRKDSASRAEMFLYRHYAEDWSERIVRILLRLACYYEVGIYYDSPKKDKYGEYRNKDLSGERPAFLRKLAIHAFTSRRFREMYVWFKDEDIVMEISSFQVVFNGLEQGSADEELIRKLVEREGLFLWEKEAE